MNSLPEDHLALEEVFSSLEKNESTSSSWVQYPKELVPEGRHPIETLSPKGHLINAIVQTASFRFQPGWSEAHQLLTARGIDPLGCIMIEVDQGDDVCCGLWLPCACNVLVDFKRGENPPRDFVSISAWKTRSYCEEHGQKSPPSAVDRFEEDWIIAWILTGPQLELFDQYVSEESQTHRFERNFLEPKKHPFNA